MFCRRALPQTFYFHASLKSQLLLALKASSPWGSGGAEGAEEEVQQPREQPLVSHSFSPASKWQDTCSLPHLLVSDGFWPVDSLGGGGGVRGDQPN